MVKSLRLNILFRLGFFFFLFFGFMKNGDDDDDVVILANIIKNKNIVLQVLGTQFFPRFRGT